MENMFRHWRWKFPMKELPRVVVSRDDDGKTEQKVQKASKNKGGNMCPYNVSTPVVPYTKQEINEFLDKNDNILSRAELNNAFEVTRSRFPAYRTWQARRADSDSGGTDGDGRIGQEEMEELLNFVTRLNHQFKP